MMKYLEQKIQCPHCQHDYALTIDSSSGNQNLYDECPSCSLAIHLDVVVDANQNRVQLSLANDEEMKF